MKKNTFMNIAVAILAVQMVAAPAILFADDAAKQQELLAAKKKELNGHEWEMKITQAGGKGTPGADTLTFKDMKFESKSTASQGFKPTNYTISLQEGGPSIWETMQSDDKGAVIFWRGEWEGESMHGVISKQSGGKNEDSYFSSVSSKPVADTPKPVESPKVEVPVPAAAESAAPAAAEAVEKAADKAAETVGNTAVDTKAAAEKAAEKMEVPAAASQAPAAVPSPEQGKNKKKWLF